MVETAVGVFDPCDFFGMGMAICSDRLSWGYSYWSPRILARCVPLGGRMRMFFGRDLPSPHDVAIAKTPNSRHFELFSSNKNDFLFI